MPVFAEEKKPIKSSIYVQYIPKSGSVYVPRLAEEVYVGDPRIQTPARFDKYNRYTGEPIENPDWRPVIYLTEDRLKALAEWRNEFDNPWSTAAYEKPFTMETVHNHGIRMAIAVELWTIELSREFYSVFLDLLELDQQEREMYQNRTSSFWRVIWQNHSVSPNSWFIRNVSEYAANGDAFRSGISECFAWVTSPSYVKGSLPERIEELMEMMAKAEHPGLGEKLERHRDGKGDLDERLPSLMVSLEKARRLPDPDKPLTENPIIGYAMHQLLFNNELEKFDDKKYGWLPQGRRKR